MLDEIYQGAKLLLVTLPASDAPIKLEISCVFGNVRLNVNVEYYDLRCNF